MTMLRNHRSAWRQAMWPALLLHLTLSGAATSMAAVEVTVENVEAPAGSEVKVPIHVRGASGLEGLQFVLRFDPQALALIDVAAAPLAGAADISLKEREPGALRVAMLPESALGSGEGTLLLVRFKVLAKGGTDVHVGIEEAKASEFREQFPVWMQVTANPGVVSIVATPATRPWLWIGVAASVVLLLFLAPSSLHRRETG